MPTVIAKLNIKPLGDRVVVEIEEDESTQTSPGGIYIPDTAREKPQVGKIIAVGPGKMLESGKREEMSVKVGEKVLFAKYGGTDIKNGDTDIKILSERDILGVVE